MASSSSSFNLSDKTSSSNKSSGVPPDGSKWVEVYVQLVFLVILMVVIITGNLLVIVAYKLNRRLRTGTYTLLVSLACCDFLVGSVSLSMWIKVIVTHWNVSPLFDKFFQTIDYLTALSSAFHLSVICLERWLAISRPFYHQTLSNKQYYTAIGFVWLISLLVSSLVFVPSVLSNKYYILVLEITGFIIPMFIITFVNVYIFKVAKRLINQEPTGSSGNDRRIKVQKERRTAKTLVIITALFFLELLPTYVLALLGGFCLKRCLADHMSWPELLRLMNIAKWMQYSNSGVNPFIYAFRDHEMRQTFQRITSRVLSFRPFSSVANYQSEHHETGNNTNANINMTDQTTK